jgi:hypothetical protein
MEVLEMADDTSGDLSPDVEFERGLAEASTHYEQLAEALRKAGLDPSAAEEWFTLRRCMLMALREMRAPDFGILVGGSKEQPRPNPLLAIYRDCAKGARSVAAEIRQMLNDPSNYVFVGWVEFNERLGVTPPQ